LNVKELGGVLGLIALIATLSIGATLYIHGTFQTKGEAEALAIRITANESKADYLLDLQIARVIDELNQLHAKAKAAASSQGPDLTPYDIKQIDYLERELERLRGLKKGV
jgi:uncharacterized protein HemX